MKTGQPTNYTLHTQPMPHLGTRTVAAQLNGVGAHQFIPVFKEERDWANHNVVFCGSASRAQKPGCHPPQATRTAVSDAPARPEQKSSFRVKIKLWGTGVPGVRE